MATFPALIPVSRTFTAATYPGAVQLAYSGRESRVRTSNAQTGARFRLAFPALSESEMLAIRDHYWGQRGRFVPFQLSTELLSGMANPSAVTPTGYQWIYVSSPRVTDIPAGTAQARSCRHDVELELELVPEVSALVSGANWVVLASIAGGVADSGDILLPGASWIAAASITGGTAIYDGLASGAAWSAAATIAGGVGSGDNADVPGASWSAAAVMAGGAASDGTPDPYFSSVSLLLHMDTAFTDSSSAARTVTVVGNAQISTAQSKYGGGSGLFDGSGDYLTIGDAAAMEPGSSDLTWEMWVKTTASNSYATLYSRTPSTFSSGMFTLMINQSSPTSGNVALYVADYSGGAPLLATTGVSVRDDSWHHIAVVRNGSSWAIYVDGTSRATATWSGTIADISAGVYIGRDQNYFFEGRDFPGYIDELRITKGVARYTTNFTPPTAASQQLSVLTLAHKPEHHGVPDLRQLPA